MQTSIASPKPHYAILDGLRGVASILVVMFHLFEALALGDHQTQLINHGYLAVDFFFLLSGFVMGYAYDNRWSTMTVTKFFQIRLIRLQPLVVLGTLIGAVLFYGQDSVLWPLIHEVPLWKMLLVSVIGITLIPLPLSMNIRGWGEMHPLNAVCWSLFYEYVVNILYAVWVRRWSNMALGVLVALSAVAVVTLAVFGPAGDVIGGWSFDAEHIPIGLTRVMYPFFAGLLLSRTAKLVRIPYAFIGCSFLLVAILAWPRIGGTDQVWQNGLYESVCILFIFPCIVYIGAGGQVEGTYMAKVCRFLGAISYPLYVTHYPLVYCYLAWVSDNKITLAQGWPWGLAVLVVSVGLAYGSLKLYDEPARKWLRARVLKR